MDIIVTPTLHASILPAHLIVLVMLDFLVMAKIVSTKMSVVIPTVNWNIKAPTKLFSVLIIAMRLPRVQTCQVHPTAAAKLDSLTIAVMVRLGL